MQVELFAMADFAADYGGKLSVVGVFDHIHARQIPAVHPQCSLALKLRFEKREEGQKRLRLSISDADGNLTFPEMEIPMQVAMPADVQSNAFQVVANIAGLKFDRFGEYSVDLAIDGQHEARIPLLVRQVQ